MRVSKDSALRLSRRQRECLNHVYERRTSKEIAALTGLGVGTVDTYISEAVSSLRARNRRHAAEMLHALEAGGHDPGTIEFEETGVEPNPATGSLIEAGGNSGAWAALLPLRIKGALGNDLRPLARIAWILQIAIAGAIGFGMLVVGLDVLSRFLG